MSDLFLVDQKGVESSQSKSQLPPPRLSMSETNQNKGSLLCSREYESSSENRKWGAQESVLWDVRLVICGLSFISGERKLLLCIKFPLIGRKITKIPFKLTFFHNIKKNNAFHLPLTFTLGLNTWKIVVILFF